jgi:hypothetical protein
MKYETYSDYDSQATSQTLPAFLTVWSGLGAYHDDLVLVGGLVPQFICRHPTNTSSLPRPATLDVDFGISLAASAGQYGTLSTDLRAQGFRPSAKYPGRFEKSVEGFPIYIDFLVEDGEASQGTRMVDDVVANVMPGVTRALATARTMKIESVDLWASKQSVMARVCEVGPFLVFKLRAFLHRQQGKDAFDLLYTMLHYDKGTSAAVQAFAAERVAQNPAFPDARQALSELFTDEKSPGAIKAAGFVFGMPQARDSEDLRMRRIQVQQDMYSAASLLSQVCS